MESSDVWLGTDHEDDDHDVKVKASSADYTRPDTSKAFWLKEVAKAKEDPSYNIFCGQYVHYDAVARNEIASAMGWTKNVTGAAKVLQSIEAGHARAKSKGKREG